VATEPGAQAARTGLLTSRADRERVIELLKAAFVQGRLAKDEFDARVGHALMSRTYADLAAAGAGIPAGPAGIPAGPAGIPAGPAGTMPPHAPARGLRRVPMNAAITGGALVMLGANVGMLAAFMSGSAVAMVVVALFTVIGTILAIGAMIVAP
jgi:Domain of unknown function (DUF1707)